MIDGQTAYIAGMNLSSVQWYLLFCEDLVHLPCSDHPLSLIILLNLVIIPDSPSSMILISGIPFSHCSSALGVVPSSSNESWALPTPDHHSFDLLTFPSLAHSPLCLPPSLSVFQSLPCLHPLLSDLVPSITSACKTPALPLRPDRGLEGKPQPCWLALLNSWPLTSKQALNSCLANLLSNSSPEENPLSLLTLSSNLPHPSYFHPANSQEVGSVVISPR